MARLAGMRGFFQAATFPFLGEGIIWYSMGMRVPNHFQLRQREGYAGLFASACLVCVAGFVHATGEVYSPPPFGHYQPILDRMPFGALPPNFNAAPADAAELKSEAQEKAEQQKLAKQVNMSAVNVTPDGSTAIGFTDLSQKPPVNYYLLVGSEADGWKVLSADYDAETATIEKEGVAITLQLGKGMVDPAAPVPAAAQPALARNRTTLPTLLSSPDEPRSLSFSRKLGAAGVARRGRLSPKDKQADASASRSFMERLRERDTQKTQALKNEAAKHQEELVKLAREAAQKELRKRDEEAALAAQESAAQVQQEEAVDPAETQEAAPPQVE